VSRYDNIGSAGWFVVVLLVAAIVAAVTALSGWIAMVLWNWVGVGVFGAREITFWEGVGVSLCVSFVGSAFRGATKESS
jgi:hypothetical protein